MIKLLFVCHGNICRSPMAECVMRQLVKDAGRTDIEVASAATSTEEIGNSIHRGTVRKLTEMSVPMHRHHAHQITPAEAKTCTLIFGMDSANMRNLRRMLPSSLHDRLRFLPDYACLGRDIADPWYTGNFDATYNDVLACCTALLKTL